jgi:hypothetical protein
MWTAQRRKAVSPLIDPVQPLGKDDGAGTRDPIDVPTTTLTCNRVTPRLQLPPYTPPEGGGGRWLGSREPGNANFVIQASVLVAKESPSRLLCANKHALRVTFRAANAVKPERSPPIGNRLVHSFRACDQIHTAHGDYDHLTFCTGQSFLLFVSCLRGGNSSPCLHILSPPCPG